MDIWQILMTPFSWLLKTFIELFNSYGIALILFTLVVKVILFPLSLKGKKSMIKMSLVSSQVREIQRRCGTDRERCNREVQKFYADNKINPMGGCGWSLIPLAILMPLYAIIRRPLKYLMGVTDAGTAAVANALGMSNYLVGGTGELTLAAMMNSGNLETAKAAAMAAGASAGGMFIINFHFLGLDLSQVPTLNFWANGVTWGTFGLFLMPIISAILSFVSMIVSQRTNKVNANQEVPTNRTMMLMSPLISLWIGYTLPAGLCVYWIANSIFMMAQEVICSKILKKDYEAAQREMEAMALKAKEEEKVRRQKAAQRKAQAIAEGKGKKGQYREKKKHMDVSASREGMRTYARGRAYDPNRYAPTPYWDPNPEAHHQEEVLEEDSQQTKLADTSKNLAPQESPSGTEGEQTEDYEESSVLDSEESQPES